MTKPITFLAFSLSTTVIAGCTASNPADDDRASTSADTVEVAPDVAKHYIQYNGTFAYEEIILHADTSYHVILGPSVFTGHWVFDLPTSTVTLTPDDVAVAPPALTYPVKRDDCHPSGWFPVLMNDGRKMIPYGIDPDFEAQYCELWSPAPTR